MTLRPPRASGSRRAPLSPASRPLGALALAFALALGARPAVGADPKQARVCADAHYESQKLRDDGKLVEARKRLVACSQESCPRAVSRECAELLVEVDKVTPSLILKAVDAQGHDLFDVEAGEGGERFEVRPDGKATSVDPGPHVYRLTHSGQVVEERVLMREGEQRRVVVVRFDQVNVPPPAPPAPGAPASPDAASAVGRGRHLTAASIAFGGLGLVALGSFAYFGLAGRGDYERLRDDCDRSCAPGDVRDTRSKLLVADISLGVGVASLATATALFLFSADSPASGAKSARGPRPALVPIDGGVLTSLGGAF
jgi:hypothetical protein